MDHEGMDHDGMDHEGMDHEGMDHEGMDHEGMDHEGIDHGGIDHGGMDMARPGGSPLPREGDDDRDGLEMDVLHVPLGPVLPHWPAGLVVWCVLQGDVIVSAAGAGDVGRGRAGTCIRWHECRGSRARRRRERARAGRVGLGGDHGAHAARPDRRTETRTPPPPWLHCDDGCNGHGPFAGLFAGWR